jgi:predicted nucleic acid-binding Zn ribbon protein
MPIGEEHRRKRGRNYALAAVLFFLVILFFVVSVVKMGGG